MTIGGVIGEQLPMLDELVSTPVGYKRKVDRLLIPNAVHDEGARDMYFNDGSSKERITVASSNMITDLFQQYDSVIDTSENAGAEMLKRNQKIQCCAVITLMQDGE